MEFVEFVEGNIKGGVRCALRPHTVVCGPNGSAKSAVINTLELALTGRASDIAGRREVAREADLMALAPGRKGELLARAALSGGSEAIYRAGGKTKKARHTYPEKLVDPATVLPLRPVYDALLGSADTSRRFFLQYAIGAVTDADVLRRLPEPLHSYYKRATLSSTLSTASAVDRLLAALEHAKTQSRAAKATAKSAESLGEEVAQTLEPLPTDAELNALVDQLRNAEMHLDELKARKVRLETRAVTLREEQLLVEQLAACERTLNEKRAQHEAAAARLQATPVPQGADPAVVALRTTIEAHVASGQTTCQCCGQQVPSGRTYFAERLRQLDEYLAQAQAQSDEYAALRRVALDAQSAEAAAYSNGHEAWTRLQAIRAAAAAPVYDVSPEALIAAEAHVQELQSHFRRIDVLKASWDSAARARTNANEATQTAEEWSKLAVACADAISQLLDAGVSEFVKRVGRRLPADDEFALALHEGDRAVFQVGLRREGIIHTALSAAEWSRVTAAIASVCRPLSPSMLSVVIPAERDFDPHRLALVLEAFGQIEDSQVVMTSPIEPASMPPGWLLVDTNTHMHRPAGPPEHSDFDAPDVPAVGG